MNKLVKPDNVSNGLELKLEKDFTPDEILVAKSILVIKANYGIAARLQQPLVVFAQEGNKEMADYVDQAIGALSRVTKKTEDIAKEYAKRLGISEERFKEIHDYVYSIERQL